MLYLTSFKIAADLLIAKFFKYLTASSYLNYLHEKGSVFSAILRKLRYEEISSFFTDVFPTAYYYRKRYSERFLLFFYMSYD